MTSTSLVVAVAVAAAAGAMVRALLSRFGWPSTLAVNLFGSFLLGVVIGSAPGDDLLTVAGTGFCGTLTTYSTFALEADRASGRQRILIVATNVVGCVAVAAIGFGLA
jgi:CrcB protein